MIKARSAVIAFCLNIAISACSGGNAAKAAADSVVAGDSASAADSARTAISGAANTTGTTGETRKVNDPATSNPPTANVIGRDSVTGLVGMIDSHGKVTRLKRKY